MNAIDHLVRDHRMVEKLFAEFLTASSARRGQLLGPLYLDLLAHTVAEEEVLYPALQFESLEQVQRARQEHADFKRTLEDLRDIDIAGDAFATAFCELMQNVQTHIREEEEPGGLMALARQRFSASQLNDMGREVDRIKSAFRGFMAA